MPNTTTETKPVSPVPASSGESGLLGPKKPESARAPKPAPSEVPIVLRALMGFSGLALLVGFFFPWVRNVSENGGDLSGLALLTGSWLGGAPPVSVVIVPVLGALLAVTAFMGFRYAAYVAIGVSVVLFGYAAYVFFLLFIAHTAVGLWITTGSAFITLLLGAGTLSWMRRAATPKASKPMPETSSATSAEKA